jgi:hypothetical protein
MVGPPEIWWCKGQVSSKYGGAGDRSIFGYENMVVQGTDQLKIWWCRGQISSKEQNMVVQGTDHRRNMVVQGTGPNSKVNNSHSLQHFLRLSL